MSLIDSWDEGGTWDSGLQWDVNIGPTPGLVSEYTDLITSEHNTRPNFMLTVATVLQPFADIMELLNGIPALFDLDNAVGEQEDFVGQWIGLSRSLHTPISGVYFSLDDANLGLDLGILQGPFDPTNGIIILPDDQYRLLLRAQIAINQWDGTIPGAYAAFAQVFAGTGNSVLIFDEGGMHMALGLVGPNPNPITLALFAGGYFNLRPSGVQIDAFYTPGAVGAPFFGLDADTTTIGGLDHGAFGIPN